MVVFTNGWMHYSYRAVAVNTGNRNYSIYLTLTRIFKVTTEYLSLSLSLFLRTSYLVFIISTEYSINPAIYCVITIACPT